MATMGPSIHDVDILSQMLEAGMVSGRVDLTWGPLEFHRNSLSLLQVRWLGQQHCLQRGWDGHLGGVAMTCQGLRGRGEGSPTKPSHPSTHATDCHAAHHFRYPVGLRWRPCKKRTRH